ncbi:MAG: DUF2029 domain-containing protein [Candidatus Omnitrophica bacterium]|nr:DUF2029 domain-containing protein [Candidatus Omnitrophota bacterium]
MSAITRHRWLLRAALGLLVAYSLVHFLKSGVLDAMGSGGGDFRSAFPGPLIFDAAKRWPWLSKEWLVPWFVQSTDIWNYGPVLHFLTVPLMLAPTKQHAMVVVLWIDYALAAAAFALWVRLLLGPRPRPAAWLLLACVWLNYFPFVETLAGREIEVLELCLITASLWALRRGREGLAGAAIGIAAMTKFLPAILVPYLFLKGFRKAGWTALAVLLALAGLGQWLLGFENSLTMRVVIGGFQAEWVPTSYSNQALSGILYKMFTVFNPDLTNPPVQLGAVLWPVGLALRGTVFLAGWWWLWRARRSPLLDMEMAFLLLLVVITAPHAHTYYLVFALPALSVGVAAWLRDPNALGRMTKAALVAAVLLSGFIVPMSIWGRLMGYPNVIAARVLQGWSLPGFGAILAMLVLVDAHRRASSAGRPEPVLPQATDAAEPAAAGAGR